MDHEVQSRAGSSTGCSRGRLAEGTKEVGTKKSGGGNTNDSDRGEVGKDNKDKEDYTERSHAGG